MVAYPVLYDTSLYLYKDINKKNEAWRRFADVVGAPGVFVLLLNSVSRHIT